MIWNLRPKFYSHAKTSSSVKPQLILSRSSMDADCDQGNQSNQRWIPIPLLQTASTTAGTRSIGRAAPDKRDRAQLRCAYEALLRDGQKFFDLPAHEKKTCKNWRNVPGEKEYIVLESLRHCPAILQQSAKDFWRLSAAHLEDTLEGIESSLGMRDQLKPPGKGPLRRLVNDCADMPTRNGDKAASVLELCLYETREIDQISEHCLEFGLLSMVVDSLPGLEIWNGDRWDSVEKEGRISGERPATVLVGRQLQRLSNGRYPASWHKYVSYGRDHSRRVNGTDENLSERCKPVRACRATTPTEQRRLSITFSLRAHAKILDPIELETNVTGVWEDPLVHGVQADCMFGQGPGSWHASSCG